MADAEINVIKENDLKALGDKYEYIAIVSDMLYHGYTLLTHDELENVQRAKPFIKYRYRQEFENYLAKKYEIIQNTNSQKNGENKKASSLYE